MSQTIIREIDVEPTQALATDIASAVRQHFLDRPLGQQSVFEALNALACVAAFVIAGTAPDETASRAFFTAALDQQIVSEGGNLRKPS